MKKLNYLLLSTLALSLFIPSCDNTNYKVNEEEFNKAISLLDVSILQVNSVVKTKLDEDGTVTSYSYNSKFEIFNLINHYYNELDSVSEYSANEQYQRKNSYEIGECEVVQRTKSGDEDWEEWEFETSDYFEKASDYAPLKLLTIPDFEKEFKYENFVMKNNAYILKTKIISLNAPITLTLVFNNKKLRKFNYSYKAESSEGSTEMSCKTTYSYSKKVVPVWPL